MDMDMEYVCVIESSAKPSFRVFARRRPVLEFHYNLTSGNEFERLQFTSKQLNFPNTI